jgi:predicted metalloprotease with PDZ domain
MYISRQDSFAGLLPQLAHEAFHAWNPAQMGALSSEADRTTKWFMEGFTNYYGYLLVYRAGALPIANYIDSINRDLRHFPVSADPYVRGRVIALWLDSTIRRESNGKHSLDDVMFDMVRTADRPITNARILDTSGRYVVSAEARTLLQRAVLDQGSLPAPDQVPLINGCVHTSVQDLPTFDLGLDLARSRTTNQITGVVEGGPAFVVGLRDGQALTGVSVYNGDPDRLAKFTIRTDEGNRQISFYPRGKTVAVRQYSLDQSPPCGRVP